MRTRIPYLDFLRCLAIVLVVALHASIPILVNTALYQTPSWYLCMMQNSINRMGVPLFFMISGYLMLNHSNTANVGDFYRKNLLKLVIPLLIWNLVYYLVDLQRSGGAFSASEFLGLLLNQGSGYHMWFIYTLLGIYLMLPFLKRIVDTTTPAQQLILLGIILFPTTLRPLLNMAQPIYIFLFNPMMEGYIGYVLLGFWLGNWTPSRRARSILYLSGIAGYFLGVIGNLATASAEAIPLPFNGGYTINHYLPAAAIFIWVRTLFDVHDAKLAPVSGLLAKLSNLVFGVYWVHVLVLNLVVHVIGSDMSILQFLFLSVSLTTLISFGFAALIQSIPILKKWLG